MTSSGVFLPPASGEPTYSSTLLPSWLFVKDVLLCAKMSSEPQLEDSVFLLAKGETPGDNPDILLVTFPDACFAKISEILWIEGDKDALPTPEAVPFLSGEGFVATLGTGGGGESSSFVPLAKHDSPDPTPCLCLFVSCCFV